MIESLVAQIASGVITAVISFIAVYITRKTGIKIDAELQELATQSLTKQAEKAVAYAEEKAAATFKEHEITLIGKEKLDEALDFIDSNLPDKLKKQIGNKLTDVATKEIESALARIEDIGATQLKTFLPKF